MNRKSAVLVLIVAVSIGGLSRIAKECTSMASTQSTAALPSAGTPSGQAVPREPETAKPKERPRATADFYVATDGDDRNPGTLAKPFRTLTCARDRIRELKRRGQLNHPLTVMIRGGTYALSQSVVFTGRDSGTEKFPITYLAFPGEQPVFSGGRKVAGWKVYRDKIMFAQLPAIENQSYLFRELFFNGQRQIRARYPNYDPQNPHYRGWAFIESTAPAESTAPITFRYEDGVFPHRWAKPEQGEIFIIPGLAWISQFIPIRAVDHDQRLITVTRRLATPWDRLTKGNRFYVVNMLEDLDQPGEWCFDSDTLTLYFWPPSGNIEDAEVTVPVLDRLIELRATTPEPVRYLRFYGLTFTQTLTGFPYIDPLHPDYVDCNRSNSSGFAFYMENAEHCAVENCRFDQVGGDAIRLHGYSGYNRIVGNEIVGAGAQGITIAYMGLWPYDYPPIWRGQEAQLRSVSDHLPWAIGNVIANNHIHDCGVLDNFGAGIHIHGVNADGNVIAHNSIHDMPHHAIYLSMGFGRNVIEYNEMHNLCYVMADAGGIYCNRWSILEGDEVLGKGNIIRYNFIRNVLGVHPFGKEVENPGATKSQDRIRVPYFTWGIYFDNSPRHAQIYGNITIGNVWGGVFLGGGYATPMDNVVENNIFIESSVQQVDLSMRPDSRGNRFVRNIVYFTNPEAALLRTTAPNGLQECDYNIYFRAGGGKLKLTIGDPRAKAVPLEESFAKWLALGFDKHSLVTDPLFVDPAKGDYRLKPESPAFKLGFKPIPLRRIGRVTHTKEIK